MAAFFSDHLHAGAGDVEAHDGAPDHQQLAHREGRPAGLIGERGRCNRGRLRGLGRRRRRVAALISTLTLVVGLQATLDGGSDDLRLGHLGCHHGAVPVGRRLVGVDHTHHQILVVPEVVAIDRLGGLARPERERGWTGDDHRAADVQADGLGGHPDRRRIAAGCGIVQHDVLALAGAHEGLDGELEPVNSVEGVGRVVPDQQLVGVGQRGLVRPDVDRDLPLGAVQHVGVCARGENQFTVPPLALGIHH